MSGLAGLTKETFLACMHTLEPMVELTAYLQKNHEFSYALHGKFMSDLTECRFGWYRQVNEGNYFMSLKQLLEAEKNTCFKFASTKNDCGCISNDRARYHF